MADPISAMLGGAGGGGLMGLGQYIGDVQANKNDRALNATMAKWAPFTGKYPGSTRKANAFQDLVTGALQGGAFAQQNPNIMSAWANLTNGGAGGASGGSGIGPVANGDIYGAALAGLGG